MSSIFMVSSALEFIMFLLGSAIFMLIVITAVALITWAVAGFVSATHRTP